MFKIEKSSVVALALAITLAIGFSAFKAPATDGLFWYEVSADGQTVGSYLGDTENDIPSICNQPTGDYCVLAFGPEDVEDPNASTPVLKSQVQSDPLMYQNDERHKGN